MDTHYLQRVLLLPVGLYCGYLNHQQFFSLNQEQQQTLLSGS